MIKKAAAGYAGWLCANGIVAPEKNKIYAYGMELVLSGLVNVLSVLLISILLFHRKLCYICIFSRYDYIQFDSGRC